MSETTRIFLTIYGLCALAWLAIFPCIRLGMGAGKPNHDLWSRRIDLMMGAVITVVIIAGFTQLMIALWS